MSDAPPSGPVPPFAAPHTAPAPGVLLAPPPPRRQRPLGSVALVLAVAAALLAPAVGGFVGFRIGRGAGAEIVARGSGAGFDWALLSPVRDLVLVAEVSFWVGTGVGIAAFALGIVATALRRGRGAGITAIVLSALGPALFAGCALIAVVAGAGTLGQTGGSPV